MAVNLVDRIPFLKRNRLFRKYADYIESIEFKIDPLLWILLSLLLSALLGIGTFFAVKEIIGLGEYVQLSALLFLVSLDILIGYPYIAALSRIDKIEEDLPDALRQMSDTLRSGGTYEYALKEIAAAEYGPLKKEMTNVLRKLEEGENFENSLLTLSENIDSRLVKRTVRIIIDSVAAGAGLASVLEEISEDARETHRIHKERRSRTVLQVIFMFVAGGLIAPMIFGFVSTISRILINASAAIVDAQTRGFAAESLQTINDSIQAYIFIEAIATAVMISIMRDGNLSKSIIYIPILLFVAYMSYLISGLISTSLVGAGA
ncbi:MAG: type II secretion system F family protein [Candidatus Diapherotrites archaeon]|uniref:Type II secretion system F family protein n=1 Tax=Candidatus Iainarchaeum sp. TaxID=3101447 RepID=A0A8T3YL52_9ARCH|nr:type II secretion system F family protein [Candidatus Diapherotrites archaeon]